MTLPLPQTADAIRRATSVGGAPAASLRKRASTQGIWLTRFRATHAHTASIAEELACARMTSSAHSVSRARRLSTRPGARNALRGSAVRAPGRARPPQALPRRGLLLALRVLRRTLELLRRRPLEVPRGPKGDGANKRVRVTRLVQRFPQVLDELASGAIHLTGLFLLSGHLTEDDVERLLAEARGKSKRQIEELIARWFPRPDVATTITTVAPVPPQTELSTWSGTGDPTPPAPPTPAPRTRLEPLSPASVRLELTARAAFRDKLEQAQALLSHKVPSGDLATLLELGLDLLIAEARAAAPRRNRGAHTLRRFEPTPTQRGSAGVPSVASAARTRAPPWSSWSCVASRTRCSRCGAA